MKAYKGFTRRLASIMGDGDKENCYFKPGETKRVPESKTAQKGFHCCEYICDCFYYYDYNGINRFFEVEAAGDIDEDANNRIASTEITLTRELGQLDILYAIMEYIIRHPDRKGWERNCTGATVSRDFATNYEPYGVAVARGTDPEVSGAAGTWVGVIREETDENGNTKIKEAHVAGVTKQQAGKKLKYLDGGWKVV